MKKKTQLLTRGGTFNISSKSLIFDHLLSYVSMNIPFQAIRTTLARVLCIPEVLARSCAHRWLDPIKAHQSLIGLGPTKSLLYSPLCEE